MLKSRGLNGFQLSSALSQKTHLFSFSENHLMPFRQGDRSSVKPIYLRRHGFSNATELSKDQITELFFQKSHGVNLMTLFPLILSYAV